MDDVIKVLHLSDLHFGSTGYSAAWQLVKDYIKNKIKPALVLVTGDIVNSPYKKHYSEARQSLDALHTPYLVCPGNHDRHPHGNSLGLFASLWAIVQSTDTVHAWFDNKFSGKLASADPQDFTFEKSHNRWNVRVIGLDSSVDAKYSAQGFVSTEQLAHAIACVENNSVGVDLLILIHHHHLLPIAALEPAHQSARRLLQPTIMLNAGTILEKLTAHHFNLVLHGHEHHHTLARYGTLHGNQGEIVIVGAGSATGARTFEGCDSNRAVFNLLELQANGSVWAQEICRQKDEWTGRPRVRLLDTHSIRRTRFFRSLNPSSRPTSQISKCVEFDLKRNITITETKTDWALKERQWTHITRNSSGWPSSPSMEFVWPDGEIAQVNGPKFLRHRHEDHAYRLDVCELAYEQATQIKLNFQWLGGAVLTRPELDCLPEAAGEYRNEGFEYVAVRAYNELKLLCLLIVVPSQFAPDDIRVFYQKRGEVRYYLSHELTKAIDYHANGKFSLRVPYPKKDYRYVVAWQPPLPAANIREDVLNFRDITHRDRQRAEKLLEVFTQYLMDKGKMSFKDTSVALYVPDISDQTMLREVANSRDSQSVVNNPPPSLSLRQNALHRWSWWGSIPGVVQLGADGESDLGSDMGMHPGENRLLIVPVRSFGEDGELPYGLVRIGIHTNNSHPEAPLASGSLAEAALKMLESVA